MANRTARMESIGSALLVGGEVEWEMKLRKEGKLAFKHAVFHHTISMGIGRGGLKKNDTIPFNCIFSDQMFRLSDILLFDIGLFFFLFFFLLSFLDLFLKKTTR